MEPVAIDCGANVGDGRVVEMHDGVVPELTERGGSLRAALASEACAHVALDWR